MATLETIIEVATDIDATALAADPSLEPTFVLGASRMPECAEDWFEKKAHATANFEERDADFRRRACSPDSACSIPGLSADVDTDIAPLILETWKADVATSCSCQDASALGREEEWVRGWVQVGFPTVADAQQWVRIVTRHSKGGRSLYNRITHSGCRGVICWHYEVSPYDAAYDDGTDRTSGPTSLNFIVFVYFPRGDLPVIVRRLKAHNARRKVHRG